MRRASWRVRALLPLAGYAGEPVTIRLDDPDSSPIAIQPVGALPPSGPSGTKWRFKTRALGIQRVELKLRAAGTYQVTVKARKWFPSAAANDTAANTQITLGIGTQCFTRALTMKTD